MAKILVVDDMAVFREPIAASLRLEGYKTECAEDGREALDQARITKPDLILLDISMPKMDGLTCLATMRQDPHLMHIPVIMLTADSDKDHIIQAAKLGVKNYLLKSQFSTEELLDRVQGILLQNQKGASPGEIVVNQIPSKTAASGNIVDDGVQVFESPKKIHIEDFSTDGINSIKDIKPILSRSEINEYLECSEDLKALSPTVSQVLSMCRSEKCSVDQVAKVIKQDHAISLKILKLANSPVYTAEEPVNSVSKAVMRIGLKEIQQAVLNIGVIDTFSDKEFEKHICVPKFWEHSIACGLISHAIKQRLGAKEIALDCAFTMGLLHDIGRMVYVELLGTTYMKVFDMAKKLELPLEQVESRMLLVNHADAMDRLLHAWKFPKDLIDPIAFHQLSLNLVRSQAPTMMVETSILALANRLAHALLLGSSGNLSLYPTEEFIDTLKLDAKFITWIENEIPDQVDDMKLSLLNHWKQDGWPVLKDEIKEQFSEPIRPIYLSEKSDIDAIRIFLDRVKDDIPNQPPNIGIVQIKKGRERSTLSTKFKIAEQQAEVSGLPLIIFSPKGDMILEENRMAGRKYITLPFPTTISKIITACNSILVEAPQPAATT